MVSLCGILSMDEGADSGLEVRRLLLLTRLRESPRGMTMEQLVRYFDRVSGWSIVGTTLWEGVRLVLQTLIDDKLVDLGSRFALTGTGHDYISDPAKWRIRIQTAEEIQQRLFWSSVYDIFGKALARLRTTIHGITE